MSPWTIALASFGAAAIATLAWLYHALVLRRFATVAKGRFYRAAEMGPALLESTVRRHGIRTVVDLRSPGEGVEREHRLLEGLGVAHHHLPSDQTPRPAVLERYLDILGTAEYPVLVHCCHGVGRARLFSTIYLVEHEGWSPERAAASLPYRSRRGRRFLATYVRRAGEGDAPSSGI